jgi:hypothetical protein
MKDDCDDGTRGGRGRRRPPPRPAGILAAAVTGTAVLLAACGGGPSAASGGSRSYRNALAYAHCMRAHGVPGFPDPASNGTISTSGIDLNSTLFSSARSACQDLQAGISFQLSAAQQQALLRSGLRTAACMRAHGFSNFPDPSPQDVRTSDGVLAIGIGRGLPPAESNSPRFLSALRACTQPRPGGGS